MQNRIAIHYLLFNGYDFYIVKLQLGWKGEGREEHETTYALHDTLMMLEGEYKCD